MRKTPSQNIRVKPETKAALERAAKDDLRTVPSLIEKILTEWLRAKGYLPGTVDPAASIKVEDLTAENDE